MIIFYKNINQLKIHTNHDPNFCLVSVFGNKFSNLSKEMKIMLKMFYGYKNGKLNKHVSSFYRKSNLKTFENNKNIYFLKPCFFF